MGDLYCVFLLQLVPLNLCSGMFAVLQILDFAWFLLVAIQLNLCNNVFSRMTSPLFPDSQSDSEVEAVKVSREVLLDSNASYIIKLNTNPT